MLAATKPWLVRTRQDWNASEDELARAWAVETASQALRDAAIARDPQKIRTSATRLCDALTQIKSMEPLPCNAQEFSAEIDPESGLGILNHQTWALEMALADAISSKDVDRIRPLSYQVADALELKNTVKHTTSRNAKLSLSKPPQNTPTGIAFVEVQDQTKAGSDLESTCETRKVVSPDSVLGKARERWSKVEATIKDTWSEAVRARTLEDAVTARNASEISNMLASFDDSDRPWIRFKAEQVLRELQAADGVHEFWSHCPPLSKSACSPSWIPPSPWRSRLPLAPTTATLSGLRTEVPLQHVRCPCDHELNRVLPNGDKQRTCDECRRPCLKKCFVCPRCHHDPPCKHSCSYAICVDCAKRKTENARAAQRRACSAPRSRNVTYVVA